MLQLLRFNYIKYVSCSKFELIELIGRQSLLSMQSQHVILVRSIHYVNIGYYIIEKNSKHYGYEFRV